MNNEKGKILRSMNKILRESGFVFDSEESVFKKDNWIIRFRGRDIEAYNDPCTNTANNYGCWPSTVANLINIIKDINN